MDDISENASRGTPTKASAELLSIASRISLSVKGTTIVDVARRGVSGPGSDLTRSDDISHSLAQRGHNFFLKPRVSPHPKPVPWGWVREQHPPG